LSALQAKLLGEVIYDFSLAHALAT
jgi:hypothetical protein